MWLVTLHIDTVDVLLVTATVAEVDGYGWTTFSAMAQKQVSHNVDTAAGACTAVHTLKTSLSRATPVVLQTITVQNTT